MSEPNGINRFSLRQNLRLLLTLFESKPHIIIIFHLKPNRQKLEKHHVNGSQTRRDNYHEVQRRLISVDNFFVFLRLLFFALLLLYVT